MTNQPSEVEQYWTKISASFGDTREWKDLTPQQQHAIIQSINLLMAVLHRMI